MQITKEQTLIGQLSTEGNDIIVIAGAGCGKSSTLRYQAEQLLPLGRNLLVLTFNSANAEETREHPDRPTNLFACTVHSLAFRALGLRKTANYLEWEDIPMKELTELSKQLAVSPKEQKTVLTLLRNGVTKAVVNFCQSGNRVIADKLTSYLGWYFQSEEVNLPVTEEQVDIVASVALEYWAWLSKDSNREKWTPDVYLKIYQLSRPKLKQVFDATSKEWVDVHAVASDESQDMNGVTEAIFSYQTHLQRFIVGDPNQQLYRWRGAGRAMDNFPTFTPAYLSTSFRFNSEIARMANIVLKMNNSPFLLTGSGTKTTIDTKAILCRTNAAVIQYLFGYAMQGKERIYCSLNLKQTFSKLYHINSCYFNEAPKYPNIALHKIKDRQSLEEAVAHSEELQRLVKLNTALTKQAGSLTKAKALIEKVLVSSMSEASLCISTVHAFKGLEASHVTIADDFINIKEDDNPFEAVAAAFEDQDFRCLTYVAITRAMVDIKLPWYFEHIFK